MKHAGPAALLLLVTGCAGDAGALRQQALNTTIGMDEATLVRTVGVPSRTVDAGGHRFLAYNDQRLDAVPGLGYGYGGFGYGGFGYGRFGGYGGLGFADIYPVPVERSCETTYELESGRVKSWQLRGDACNHEAKGAGVPPLAPPAS